MARGGPQEGVSREALLSILRSLSNEIRELDIGSTVDRVPNLTAVEFLREYVGPNKPVVITDAINHWPALRLWTHEYLVDAVGDDEVTVALTPNGRADAVTRLLLPQPGSAPTSGGLAHQECFALPAQRKMAFRDFLSLFYSSKQRQGQQQLLQQQQRQQRRQQQHLQQQQQPNAEPATAGAHSIGQQEAGQEGQDQREHEEEEQQQPVVYLQYQNSSLTAEVPQLLEGVDEHIPWATEALGCLPEAINIWIGDERSVTSWHKDPFENLYAAEAQWIAAAVVAGEKTFSLLPPSDVYRMRLKNYPLATYTAHQGGEQEGAAAGGEGGAEGEGGAGSWPLMPVLHNPPASLLWSSVQPEDGWRCNGGSSIGRGGSGGGSGCVEAGSRWARCDGGQEGLGAWPSSSSTRGNAAGDGECTSSSGGAGAGWAGDLFSDPQLPRPLRVTVRPGELLYLPAIWWHQVEQKADESGMMIAVNYWYDMKFDARYAHFKALEALAAAAALNESSLE